jgi:hypothetical protein
MTAFIRLILLANLILGFIRNGYLCPEFRGKI